VNAPAKVRDAISTRSGRPHTLLEQIQAEYAEMPGLSVTLPQAQRLWAVDQATCEEVFSRLISRGVLKRTSKGRFIRA
jgi:predicted transcriptional regulator of viral defense system